MPAGLSLGLSTPLAIVHDVARRGIPSKTRKASNRARRVLLNGDPSPEHAAEIDAAIKAVIQLAQRSPLPKPVHRPGKPRPARNRIANLDTSTMTGPNVQHSWNAVVLPPRATSARNGWWDGRDW